MTQFNPVVLDIETLTSADVDYLDADGEFDVHGLKPAQSVITDIQVAVAGEAHHLKLGPVPPVLHQRDGVLNVVAGVCAARDYQTDHGLVHERTYGSEANMLDQAFLLLNMLASNHDATHVVTWNGSVFDFPFITDRWNAYRASPIAALQMAPNPARAPKYDALPGHDRNGRTGAYAVRVGELPHLDVAYAYQKWADANGVTWSLKPVAEARGVEMVTVDREKMHELDEAERAAYALRDVTGLRELAVQDLEEMRLLDYVDPEPR